MPTSPLSRFTQRATSVSFFLLFALSLVALLSTLFSTVRLAWQSDIKTLIHAWPSNSPLTTYPTSFSRDVQPLPIHSHNDYWRHIPLYSALAAGAISVEADVWEFEGELYVGHDTASLSRNRTLKSLYLEPLLHILRSQNPVPLIPSLEEKGEGKRHEGEEEDEQEEEGEEGAATIRGVFDVDPSQTLHLLIDFKTPGATTLPVVLSHLDPLRQPINYLTHFNGTHIVPGALTITFTGDAPFTPFINGSAYRDYFYDAPLGTLQEEYTKYTSVMASAPFGKVIGRVLWGMEVSAAQKRKVKEQVKLAHERGLLARYWDTPGWPVSVRDRVWGVLVGEGVDLLNVDDLRAAKEMSW